MPRTLILALAFCVLQGSPLAAQEKKKPLQESAEFFASGKVVFLTIDLAPKELEALRREPRKYVKATLKEGDKIVFQDVGIHLKGAAGSFRGIDDKPGLTLNMNKFVDDQLFHGMDKFHLANSVQDPSYVAELVCGELFRAAGVPASRISHAVVTVNGRRRGLYYLKEGYDKYFLSQYFKNTHGNFYDGGFLRDIDQPLELLRGKDDVKDRADLKALAAAAKEKDPKIRFQKMEKLLDLDKFVTFLVLESVTWDWDGYPMNRNNYRIYHEPKLDKIIFIPSGMDQMFSNPGGPVLPDFQGLIAHNLMSTPQGRALYFEKMDHVMKNVYNPEALGKRLDELQERIQPVLASIDAGAGRDYPQHINRMKQAIQQRAKSIDTQLKQQKK
jgi:spore coat protein CotH